MGGGGGRGGERGGREDCTHMMENGGLCDEVSIDIGWGIANGGDVDNAFHVVNDAVHLNTHTQTICGIGMKYNMSSAINLTISILTLPAFSHCQRPSDFSCHSVLQLTML